MDDTAILFVLAAILIILSVQLSISAASQESAGLARLLVRLIAGGGVLIAFGALLVGLFNVFV